MAEAKNPYQIKLTNVRLSYPHLFAKASYDGVETKFEATFLLNKEKHAEKIKEIKGRIKELLAEKLKGVKLGPEKFCLRDGDDKDVEGYAGCMTIKAGNSRKPRVVDRDKSDIDEDAGIIYPGCYVNAVILLWAQNNKFGKRVNANLLGVQFYRDGAHFGEGGKIASVDDFDEVDDEAAEAEGEDDTSFDPTNW